MLLERIWTRLLQLTAEFVTPDWGAIIGVLPVLFAVIVIAILIGVFRRLWIAAGRPSRQAADQAEHARRHPHARPLLRPGLRGGRRVPAVPRPGLRWVHPGPRRDRARPDAPVLAGRGRPHLRPRHRADRAAAPGRDQPGSAARRPHARSVVAPVPRRVRGVRPVPRPRLRRLGPDRRASSPSSRPWSAGCPTRSRSIARRSGRTRPATSPTSRNRASRRGCSAGWSS